MYLSKKHSLNPMVSLCFFCGKEKNEIILFGKLKKDKEAPLKGVIMQIKRELVEEIFPGLKITPEINFFFILKSDMTDLKINLSRAKLI